MEYFKDILCISTKELLKERNPFGLIPTTTYQNWTTRGKVKVLRAGKEEGNYALIQFDTLPPKYQVLAKERFGNPETESQKHEILKYIEHDSEVIFSRNIKSVMMIMRRDYLRMYSYYILIMLLF